MSGVELYVCTHQQGTFCPRNDGYKPLFCGKAHAESKNNSCRDDNIGENINEKNRTFCELTGLYWIWKNPTGAAWQGLCHYRRFLDFHASSMQLRKERVVRSAQRAAIDFSIPPPEELFRGGEDMILPRPAVHFCSVAQDYALHYNSEDFRTLRKVVHTLTPTYDRAFHDVTEGGNQFSHFNIFLASRETLEKYCEWLFPILFEAERQIDTSRYSSEQARIFGYFGERLLNVYVRHNRLKIKYLPILIADDNFPEAGFAKTIYANVKSRFSFFFLKPRFQCR